MCSQQRYTSYIYIYGKKENQFKISIAVISQNSLGERFKQEHPTPPYAVEQFSRRICKLKSMILVCAVSEKFIDEIWTIYINNTEDIYKHSYNTKGIFKHSFRGKKKKNQSCKLTFHVLIAFFEYEFISIYLSALQLMLMP